MLLRAWLRRHIPLGLALLIGVGTASMRAEPGIPAKSLAQALSPQKWEQVQKSVDHALTWLASQQSSSGAFPTLDAGQPAVTSLCVMAFLSRGYQPGSGPYGTQLERAIDFVVSCQKQDGLLSYRVPEPYYEPGPSISHAASYNNAIGGLMLGEVYGHVTGPRARRVRQAIKKALAVQREWQSREKPFAEDVGGVRYRPIKPGEPDADLSITAWTLMFYRSAKNAEFNVPQHYVNEAVSYVRRCWNPQMRMFNYTPMGGGGTAPSRGLTGAGILSLSLAGQHNSAVALAAGDWLVAHPFTEFGQTIGLWDQYFYSTYYCSQAAAQLGGKYWENIFPPLVDAALAAQESSGVFPPEEGQGDRAFGQCYTTAMAVLALTPAYQLLPVYQR
jgi:hypothetical protein